MGVKGCGGCGECGVVLSEGVVLVCTYPKGGKNRHALFTR